ncbi:MAG: hypothetical protein AB7G06_00140 [Bdellovibrionales bacterium]
MKKAVVVLALVLGLPGCASIIEGTTQEILINTTPQGAQCQITRDNMAIASVMKTPEAALVERTKHDLIIKCWKDGCDESQYFVNSGTSGGTFGNILLGGGIGWAIDSAAGADNEYEKMVNIPLYCEKSSKSSARAKKKVHQVNAPAPEATPDDKQNAEDSAD